MSEIWESSKNSNKMMNFTSYLLINTHQLSLTADINDIYMTNMIFFKSHILVSFIIFNLHRIKFKKIHFMPIKLIKLMLDYENVWYFKDYFQNFYDPFTVDIFTLVVLGKSYTLLDGKNTDLG